MYGRIAFLLALVAINYVVWRDRANIERAGVILVRRTEAGLAFLDRVSRIPIWK